MTVKELQKILSKVENDDAEVVIWDYTICKYVPIYSTLEYFINPGTSQFKIDPEIVLGEYDV